MDVRIPQRRNRLVGSGYPFAIAYNQNHQQTLWMQMHGRQSFLKKIGVQELQIERDDRSKDASPVLDGCRAAALIHIRRMCGDAAGGKTGGKQDIRKRP